MRQHSIPFATIFALTAVGLTAACTEPDATLGTATSEQRCEDWGCTGNSSTMGPYRSHEFNLAGLPNDEGLRVDGFYLGGVKYAPRIQDDHLYAKHVLLGELHGGQLENGYLKVLDKNNKEFRIHIANVSDTVTFWVGDQMETVETYELVYSEPPVPTTQPLCKNPPGRTDASGSVWSQRFEAVLYTGDRIDSRKKIWATTAAATSGWMTIGCAGSALAKMHLSRHTTAGTNGSFSTEPNERQALLNMFTANLCGNGVSYTQPDTPLRWKNAAGWYPEFAGGVALEAVWGPDGAVCLDDAYRLDSVDPFAVCRVARSHCADLPGYDENSWQSWGTVRSAVP